jgi:serine/threonine protein kinase
MEILNKYVYDPQMDLLGKGGFATVYKAYDKVLEMPVALKFFHPQDQANKYTIINEIKRAIILAHPNIVKYYGVETLVNRNFHGQDEEVQIGVMEFVQEGQLKTFMSQNPLSTDQLKKLLIDILEGLKYLHSEGIIHRDIKPQNILLGRDKQNRLVAKIADFGISKSADSNQASASILLGTIEYMAPEQFNPERYGVNKKIGYNVDIWAFGVTAYYLLTGNLLFGSRSGDTSAAQMISKIVAADGMEEKLNSVQEPFRAVLQKCVVPDANIRTNDIDELIAILKGHSYQKDTSTPAPAPASAPLTHFANSGPVADDHTMEISKPAPAAPAKKEKGKKAAHAPAPVDEDSTMEIQLPGRTASITEEPVSAGGGKSRKILVAAIIILVLGGGGYFAYSKFVAGGDKANAEELVKKQQTEKLLFEFKESLQFLQGGDFTEGTDDPKRNTDGPAHKATVAPYWLADHEITQAEWNAVMNDNRYTDAALANFPADSISWEDAKRFIDTLNQTLKTYQQENTELLKDIKAFRLPTSAEWEFACEANALPGQAADLDKISWNMTNSGKKSHAVKTKEAGASRLYDMLGNVYEWCEDWYGAYQTASDQRGKVLRGGDYENDVFFVHEKARNAEVINKRNKNIGFRIAADKAEITK